VLGSALAQAHTKSGKVIIPFKVIVLAAGQGERVDVLLNELHQICSVLLSALSVLSAAPDLSPRSNARDFQIGTDEVSGKKLGRLWEDYRSAFVPVDATGVLRVSSKINRFVATMRTHAP